MTQEPAFELALMSAASGKLPKHVTYVRGRRAESCITYSDLLAEVSALAGSRSTASSTASRSSSRPRAARV